MIRRIRRWAETHWNHDLYTIDIEIKLAFLLVLIVFLFPQRGVDD